MNIRQNFPPEAAEELRRIVQTQIIECLNRFYAIETGLWGGPLDALIIRTVIVGENQERLYDLSALAGVLDLPISTVHRKIRELEKAGYLTSERKGRSTYLRPTDKTCVEFDKTFEDMIGTLQRLYRPKSAPQAVADSMPLWGPRD
jgi:DNA-binding MarR family transcriptional regulator